MTDHQRPPPQAPAKDHRRVVTAAMLILAESAGFLTLIALWLTGHLVEAMWALQFVVAAAMLLAVLLAGARRRRNWTEPLARLESLIPEVLDGREPIESLSTVGGRLAPLATLVQDLLHSLRSGHANTARLHDEIRQRVATRTVALERKIGALQQQATRDPLTGLMNRRALDDCLAGAVERATASKSPLCLLMLDVDHFKPFNDTLGHAAGDELLRAIAQIIRSTIRERDSAFRCGGDEFVVVLEGCPPEPARAVAGRIASLADALGRTFRVAHPPRLSIGIASLGELRDPTVEAMMRRADQALYEVKADHHGVVRQSRRSA